MHVLRTGCGVKFTAAEHELTDAEILDRYGALLSEAHEAFLSDSTYIVEIAEFGAKVKRRRQTKREYRNRRRESDT